MIRTLNRLYRKHRLDKAKKAGLQIADDCQLLANPDCFGSEPYLVSIGPKVTITSGVRFITHDGGMRVLRNLGLCKDVHKFGRITIHENCFIGVGAILMPGVTIGPNSVVAAGSVVTKDVPPNSVAAGVPAKVLFSVEEYAERVTAADTIDPVLYKQNKKEAVLKANPRPW